MGAMLAAALRLAAALAPQATATAHHWQRARAGQPAADHVAALQASLIVASQARRIVIAYLLLLLRMFMHGQLRRVLQPHGLNTLFSTLLSVLFTVLATK